MTRELTVREAEVEDVPSICRVAPASWHAAYDDILGSETVDSMVDDWYDLDGIRENVTDAERVFLVATRDGDVVGFADSTRWGDDADIAVLARIYVDPDHWNEGVGSVLLARSEYLLERRGFDRLRLVVFAENRVGVSFYETSGFERIEERKEEFDGESHTEYVYEKEL